MSCSPRLTIVPLFALASTTCLWLTSAVIYLVFLCRFHQRPGSPLNVKAVGVHRIYLLPKSFQVGQVFFCWRRPTLRLVGSPALLPSEHTGTLTLRPLPTRETQIGAYRHDRSRRDQGCLGNEGHGLNTRRLANTRESQGRARKPISRRTVVSQGTSNPCAPRPHKIDPDVVLFTNPHGNKQPPPAIFSYTN